MWHIKSFTFNPLQENTYVLYNNNNKAILIDPGCYFTAEEEVLANFITHNGLTVELLLNTHCHLDHVFGNAWAYKTYNKPLHIHRLEEKVLAFAPISGQSWGLPFTNYAGPLHFIDQPYIQLDEDVLDVFLLPGHSPGSIGLYSQLQHFIIAGDVLFRDSIGRTDLPGGHHETLLKSIREKLFRLPNETTVYSGHGVTTTIGYEKEHNLFLQ